MVARYRILFVIAAIVVSLALAGAVMGQEGDSADRDQEFEQEVLARLEAVNPEAVPIFIQATADMNAGNYEIARTGYEAVLALAPDFPDALRRLSYVLAFGLDDAREGLGLARRALELEDNVYNTLAVVRVLAAFDTAGSRAEALSLAESAVSRWPDEYTSQFALALAGMANEKTDVVRRASQAMLQLEPDDSLGHYLAGLTAAIEERWVEAERELLKARELGYPPEEIQRVLDSGVAAEAREARRNDGLIRWGAIILGGWLGGLALLLLLGFALSQLTLANLKRPSGPELQASGSERALRSLYRAVIVLASAFYYVSMPVLILVVIAVFGGVAYLFLSAGRIPTRLLLFLGVAALATLYAIVRAIFTRVRESEPGRELQRQEAPEFWVLTEEVAEKVGTRPVDQVYLVPGPEIAVTERGGMLDKMRDRGRRLLIVGLAALEGMTEAQFKAILAHEYGHFSGRDTAGGSTAYRVQLSMRHMALRLAIENQAKWYNPAWWFVNGYYRIFLRITQGASRLQEILADRVAATAYGCQNLIDGLEHVIRCSLEFDAQANAEVKLALEEQRGLNNLYHLPALPVDDQQALEAKLRQEFERDSSAYDSHPSYKERVDCLKTVNALDSEMTSSAPVIALLPDMEGLEREMTAVIEQNVARQIGRASLAPG